jgi:two-component system NtrC family sensor kinase
VPYVKLGFAGIVVYAIVSLSLRGYPYALAVFGNGVLLASALLVIFAVLKRRHERAGCQRLFWDAIAIGMALWSIGHIGFAFDDLVLRDPSWLRWHTLFSLCGGIAPLIALLALPHLGPRRSALTAATLDLAGSGLLAIFIYTYFVLVPSLLPEIRPGTQSTLLLLVQLNRLALFSAVLVAMWFARTTAWQSTYGRLAIGIGLGFVLRIGTNLAIERGDYQSGMLHDLAWLVPWLCYSWAAWEAPASPAEGLEEPAGPAPSVLVSAVPVLLIPAIGYGVLRVDSMDPTLDSFRVLLTSVTTLCGLALLTFRLAAQSGELHRVDARLKLLAAATEQTADLILITRADGRFEHANTAFQQALGYSRRELARFGYSDLLAEGSESLATRIPADVRRQGIWRGTLVHRRKDGTTFPAACTIVALKDASGTPTHFVGVARDTSDELRLRDQLVHSERMSAIGELVAGVAHEINNPLQAIIGCVELMMDDQSARVDRRDLELVRREAARAGQIVRNLLSFVRRGEIHREPADLNQIVRATTDLREYHLQQWNIGLVLRCAPGALPVLINRDEIQQVILNLLLNAEQAIAQSADHGTIIVETRSEHGKQIVEISDTGPGIEPDMRGRIFEPFFTTKDVGQGTGLGLSISHGIAHAHGGSLELLDSTVGACFRLVLPAPRAERESAAAGDAAVPAGRRVLIVDDEAPIRRLLGRLLERRGFEVLEADTAEAALTVPEPDRLNLVVCDLRMPGLSGVALYRRLAELTPSLRHRFLFISGETAPDERNEPDIQNVPFLGKPFTAADLDRLLATIGVQDASKKSS